MIGPNMCSCTSSAKRHVPGPSHGHSPRVEHRYLVTSVCTMLRASANSAAASAANTRAAALQASDRG
eukprot:CAMPEP_0185179828 /NCGR_PEP_ID=MMETSP1139-20130426/32206_1 /TAXON_ID=298111 /ORGANISM="Pavlova sp., Strain CCMP459" /LENGTH=66 /DNA_ID=CAMNT_0027745663 /DNA_START=1150 /DNA_END=1346 /DNA_ORIENTATION=-